MRGEYLATRVQNALYWELPPRARRILDPTPLGFCTSGTTSACAENTRPDTVGVLHEWNYLRVRGEYTCTLTKPVFGRGTTSACAENTQTKLRIALLLRNYLRVRGEYPVLATLPSAAAELPPRARRIPGLAPRCLPRLGTTSACAENTYVASKETLLGRNYLRVRGEYFSVSHT